MNENLCYNCGLYSPFTQIGCDLYSSDGWCQELEEPKKRDDSCTRWASRVDTKFQPSKPRRWYYTEAIVRAEGSQRGYVEAETLEEAKAGIKNRIPLPEDEDINVVELGPTVWDDEI